MSGGKGSIVRSSDIKGLSVYDMDDKSLGKIEDVVIDTRTGQIRYAVLSFGGILGFGDKFFAIPWKKLSFVSKGETTSGTQKEDYCVLNVSKETLEKAPGFNKDAWPNFANTTWQEEKDQHYGAKEAHSRRGALR
jgi:sporulation protein YlmC with PRC-barrel domain